MIRQIKDIIKDIIMDLNRIQSIPLDNRNRKGIFLIRQIVNGKYNKIWISHKISDDISEVAKQFMKERMKRNPTLALKFTSTEWEALIKRFYVLYYGTFAIYTRLTCQL